MPSHTISTIIPVELADQIDAAAARLNRPHDWIIEQALQNWLYREEKHHQMILQGLKDIEGRVVDHADIEAWVKTLGD